MKIQSTFWTQAGRIAGEFLSHDIKLLQRMRGLVGLLIGAQRADQHEAASDFFSMLGALPNATELGFQLGKRIPVSAFGEIGLGFRVAPTLREALRYNASFHHLLIPLLDYSFCESDLEGRFNIGFRCPIDSNGEALVVAMVAAMGEREASFYSGRSGNLKGVECTSSSRGREAYYRKHLALTPKTDYDHNALVLDRALLDLPNPSADPDTFEHLKAYATTQMELRSVQLKPSGRVRESVMSNIAAPPSLESLAKGVGMTARQLRIALSREGTNYQEIVRSCRIEYASALFRNPALSVSEIAYRLGYSDLSAFTHAFSRWTGKSPSVYRIEMLLQSASL